MERDTIHRDKVSKAIKAIDAFNIPASLIFNLDNETVEIVDDLSDAWDTAVEFASTILHKPTPIDLDVFIKYFDRFSKMLERCGNIEFDSTAKQGLFEFVSNRAKVSYKDLYNAWLDYGLQRRQ